MGRIYGKRHLQMFSHPSGVSFSLPPPPGSYCLSSVWVLSDWPACSATSSLPFASKDHKRSLYQKCCSHKIWARPVRPLLSDGACSVLLLSVSETTNVIWEMTVVCWHQRLAAGIAVNRDINRVPGVMGEDTSSFLSLLAPAVSATNISTGPRNLRVHTIDWRRP